MTSARSLGILLFLLLTALPAAAQTELPDVSEASSVEERRILVAIEQEYDKLAEREEKLVAREMELKALAVEVDKKLAAMQELRDELLKLLNAKADEEGRRIGELSAMYEKMEPQKAARLIKDLDQQLAIRLLLGVKKKTAGEILNNLDPSYATELSKAFTDIPVKDRTGGY